MAGASGSAAILTARRRYTGWRRAAGEPAVAPHATPRAACTSALAPLLEAEPLLLRVDDGAPVSCRGERSTCALGSPSLGEFYAGDGRCHHAQSIGMGSSPYSACRASPIKGLRNRKFPSSLPRRLREVGAPRLLRSDLSTGHHPVESVSLAQEKAASPQRCSAAHPYRGLRPRSCPRSAG